MKRLVVLSSLTLAALALNMIAPTLATAQQADPADFTISASLGWIGFPMGRIGGFTAHGAITDAGDVYHLDTFTGPDGTVSIHLEFVGEFGTFETILPLIPESRRDYSYGLVGVGGDYAGLLATGTASGRAKSGRTRSSWGWVYYTNVSWSLEGSIP